MKSKFLALLVLVASLSGCNNPPPSCDGSNRRPINQATPKTDAHVSLNNSYFLIGNSTEKL